MDAAVKCLASVLASNLPKLESYNLTLENNVEYNSTTMKTDMPVFERSYHVDNKNTFSFQDIKNIMEVKVHPFLCIFGILGNLLNIGVLFKHRTRSMLKQRLESVAITGLVGLAVSDMCYCFAVLPKSFISSQLLFREKNFQLYYLMYSNFFINTLVHNSTWLTAHTAIMRYIAICHPLRARQFIYPKTMIISFLGILIGCIVLNLPQCWIWSTSHYRCPEFDVDIYVLSRGYLIAKKNTNLFFTTVTFVLGFLLPLCLLVFYNIHLIKELRASSKRRLTMNVQRKQVHVSYYITLTIIAVIFMFIVLITPSEIVNYFFYHFLEDKTEWLRVFMVFCNLLQTINFSFNFLLYCIVNPRFRHTVCRVFFCKAMCNCNTSGGGSIKSDETTGIQLNDVNGKCSF